MISYKHFAGTLLMAICSQAIGCLIQLAQPSDMEWINNAYDEVNFIHSDLNNEIIAVEILDGKKVGVGRLVKIENHIYELGGMYVQEEYRQNKIATKIIEFLLNQVTQGAIIYCLPFKHLSGFYKKFGFRECTSMDTLPRKIADKLLWCNKTYQYAVGCLVRDHEATIE